MEIDVVIDNKEHSFDYLCRMDIEFFLENFYIMAHHYKPTARLAKRDDLENLVQLFDDLRIISMYTAYKYFLFFHAVNHKNNARIYWELL